MAIDDPCNQEVNTKVMNITFDMQKMAELMSIFGTDDMQILQNAAYTLLRWAGKERQRGREIASVLEVDDKLCSYRILEMPVLADVKKIS